MARAVRILVARDERLGKAIWSIPWDYWSSSLAADDSLVVTYVRGAEVAAFDPANGGLRWRVHVDE